MNKTKISSGNGNKEKLINLIILINNQLPNKKTLDIEALRNETLSDLFLYAEKLLRGED